MTQTESAAGGYYNPKCYASALGDCSDKLTGEHVVSDGVLRLRGDKSVTVSHRPWSKDGAPVTMGISSFKAKILCQHHNSALSVFDDAAKTFALALTYFSHQVLTSEELVTEQEVFTASGEALQRWALKTLIAHHMASAFHPGEPRIENKRVLELLFDPAPWPEGIGLHVAPALSNPLDVQVLRNHYGGCEPFIHKDRYVIGGTVYLGGMALVLPLFRPQYGDGGPTDNAVLQPQAIQFLFDDGMAKGVYLTWEDDRDHGVVSYDVALKRLPPP